MYAPTPSTLQVNEFRRQDMVSRAERIRFVRQAQPTASTGSSPRVYRILVILLVLVVLLAAIAFGADTALAGFSTSPGTPRG